MESSSYSSKTLDHLGLVAGRCREIGISEVIVYTSPKLQPR